MTSQKRVSRIRVDTSPSKALRNNRGISRLLVNPETADIDTLDLHLNELGPETGQGPMHYHEKADNIYWVLEGQIEVTLPGEQITLGKDELMHIPPGIVHATANPGPVMARFVEIYSPPGDDFHLVEETGG